MLVCCRVHVDGVSKVLILLYYRLLQTYVFGGFNGDFYDGYNSEWPLPEGHEKRKTVYNLYHILNHEVLFGGGYLSQARSMIEQILRY